MEKSYEYTGRKLSKNYFLYRTKSLSFVQHVTLLKLMKHSKISPCIILYAVRDVRKRRSWRSTIKNLKSTWKKIATPLVRRFANIRRYSLSFSLAFWRKKVMYEMWDKIIEYTLKPTFPAGNCVKQSILHLLGDWLEQRIVSEIWLSA